MWIYERDSVSWPVIKQCFYWNLSFSVLVGIFQIFQNYHFLSKILEHLSLSIFKKKNLKIFKNSFF